MTTFGIEDRNIVSPKTPMQAFNNDPCVKKKCIERLQRSFREDFFLRPSFVITEDGNEFERSAGLPQQFADFIDFFYLTIRNIECTVNFESSFNWRGRILGLVACIPINVNVCDITGRALVRLAATPHLTIQEMLAHPAAQEVADNILTHLKLTQPSEQADSQKWLDFQVQAINLENKGCLREESELLELLARPVLSWPTNQVLKGLYGLINNNHNSQTNYKICNADDNRHISEIVKKANSTAKQEIGSMSNAAARARSTWLQKFAVLRDGILHMDREKYPAVWARKDAEIAQSFKLTSEFLKRALDIFNEEIDVASL